MQVADQALENPARHLDYLQDSLQSLTAQARAAWDEVSSKFPEALKQATSPSRPKGHTRRPDSYWDHITKGAELPNLWVQIKADSPGDDATEDLDEYNLRSKKRDPAVLGVDPGVTQYSGYLDDEENDKHLFYCGFCMAQCIWKKMLRRHP